MKKTISDDRAAELKAKVTAELSQLAASDDAIEAILAGLHAELGLWRLCAQRRCSRARGCRGEMIACAAVLWPAVSYGLQLIAQQSRRGRAARRRARLHLLGWKSEGGSLMGPKVVVVREPYRPSVHGIPPGSRAPPAARHR